MSPAARTAHFTLTTPSLGVQQWRDDASNGTTRIGWASVGGRGLARRVILLPVVQVEGTADDPRWKPPDGLMTDIKALVADERAVSSLKRKLGNAWREFDIASRRLRRDLDVPVVEVGVEDAGTTDDPAAPRSTIVSDDFGADWGAHHLVVLLVYDDPMDIGEPGDGVEYGEELEAIESFFGKRYEKRLVTRGLVQLPPLASEATPEALVFALASCQYPADMTDGAPRDHRGPEAPASASLLRLSRLLMPATSNPPSLLLLVGDQVYVDATAGLFDARSQNDRLRLPYQNLLESHGAQSVFGLLPVAMMLDDHELSDNWEPGAPLSGSRNMPGPAATATEDIIAEGKRAYRRFQRMAGPPLRDASALWCEFEHAGVPFFLADTRTERGTPDRSPRRVDNWREARIMGDEQWDALKEFLRRNRKRVSFVVSSAMLLPRSLGLRDQPSLALECDSWDGFPASMHELLALLCEEELGPVVFLSGDAHVSSAVQATVTRGSCRSTFWSVHSSGLYCPYPFANDIPDNYDCDDFDFEGTDASTHTYRCTINEVKWVEGDGFAMVKVIPSGSGRPVRVRFSRAHGNIDVW